MEIERRNNLRPVEVRADEDGGAWLSGYGVVFYDAENRGTQYDIFDGHVERIDRHAFDDTDWSETISVFNHNLDDVPLGTKRSGTLSVDVDDVGVKYQVRLPQSASSVREAVERGDVAGSSFSWPPGSWATERSKEGDYTVHTITRIDKVMDISPVTWPAYLATSAEMRDRLRSRVIEQEDALEDERDRIKREEADQQRAVMTRLRAAQMRAKDDQGYCAGAGRV